MNYCDSLFNLSVDTDKKEAFIEIDSGKKITYKELRFRVRSFAMYLRHCGIKSGDIVAIHLYNSIHAIIVHMGAQFIGAVSCWIDPLIQPKGVRYHINETHAKLFVTHCKKESIPEEIRGKTSVLNETDLDEIYDTFSNEDEEELPFVWKKDDVCYIYYTSGTTSEPKGVMLTQGSHNNFSKITDLYWQPVDEHSRHIGLSRFHMASDQFFSYH